MIKFLLGGVIVLTFSTGVFAQGVGLFPELQGQFKTDNKNITGDEKLSKPIIEPEFDFDGRENTLKKKEDEPKQTSEFDAFSDPFAVQNQIEKTTEPSGEGNVKITLTNLKGVLPYARDYAYCFGDLVLENDTNQKVEALSIKLTYRDTPTVVSFSGVDKKKTQKQSLMLIGKACEDILSTPEIEVQKCQMPPQSEESCKKRVQFIPPNG